MKTLKTNLENIQGKLSRAEMKEVTAGAGSNCCGYTSNWKSPGFTCIVTGGAKEAMFMATDDGWWACGTQEIKSACGC